MKKFTHLLYTAILIVSAGNFTYAQNDTICLGDSVCQTLSNAGGNIQWQYSTNQTNWANINGATTDTFCFAADSSGYFRAEIIDGTCNPVYSDTSYLEVIPFASSGADTFLFSGSPEMFVVPPCIDSITVMALGAQGGTSANPNNGNGIGGLGGMVEATIPVSTGDTLYFFVGQQGAQTAGGYNGGGKGADGYQNGWIGGGGGGASDIRLNDTTLNDRILVASGGGGGGSNGSTPNANKGGDGGGLTGDTGLSTTGNGYGNGGTQSAGGVANPYSWDCGSGQAGDNGVLGVGGDGDVCSAGGGGGGGYYGGAGGDFGGGGGGSSYVIGNASNVTHTIGVQTGDGVIFISW